MSSFLATTLRTITFGVALSATSAALHAQTLSGALSDDTTGPVTPGVHQVLGNISVASGKTLTVQAGAILKFNGGQLTLDGTLKAQGTSPSPVIFTSIPDDTAGGDTNGDGNASSPSPGNWQGVVFHAGSAASVLSFTDIRYAGGAGWTAVYVDQAGANFTLSHCTIRNSSQPGINFNGVAALPTVSNCTFTNNSAVAVENMLLQAVPGFSNNTASGNAGNYMHVTSATLTASLSIAPANILNGALVVAPQAFVGAGATLTLAAGCVIKVQGPQFTLDGLLVCNGTMASPVVFTSFLDDTAGGDTNNDGSGSSPSPGNWQGLTFHTGSAGSLLNFTDIRYAGGAGWTAVYVSQDVASFTLSHCTIRDSSQPGINLNNTNSFPTVSNCTFTNNSAVAVENMLIQSVPGFVHNTASGNAGNYMHVTSANLVAPLAIAPANILNGALVIAPQVNVGAGTTLTLAAGTVIKMQSGQFTLDGTLLCNGTLASPVVFTSTLDDTAAGDTNNDSNGSSPSPGNWQGLTFHTGSAASVLTYAEVRYAGGAGWTAVYVNQNDANFKLDHCTIRNSSQPGMNLNNTASFPTVTHCTFSNNSAIAVDGVPLSSVSGFTLNSASGNVGNFIRLTSNLVSSSVTVTEDNCLNGSLVVLNGISVTTGGTLHILPRVHFKMQNGQVIANGGGSLDAQGTSSGPIVFTYFTDDSIDGDTNNDGNGSAPSPGSWLDIQVGSTAAASTLNHVHVRYTGGGGFYGIWSQSPLLALHNVRSEFSSQPGFRLENAASPATDLTAFSNSSTGFDLIGGSFTLSRCTAANNSGFGFNGAGFTGSVRSVIGWNNAGGNFNGTLIGGVFFSDGAPTLAGLNGNVNADPKFVNAATGDLTLQKTSPCVDTGDPADVAFGTDDAGYPRFMDGNLDKIKIVDMGAYEFDNVHLTVTGSATPGGTLTLGTTGTSGLATYVFIGLVQDEVPLKAFGPLFMNLTAPYVLLSWAPIPSSIPIGIPSVLPTPLPIIFQELGIQGATGSDPGNLSDPVYVTIQ